jgi:uncharacterized protein
VTFADTFYYVALLSVTDSAHARALKIGHELKSRVITTEYVLLEVGDAFAAVAERPKFLRLMQTLEADESVEIVPSSSELLAKSIELFGNRMDKDWPLTDCSSFVVMQERGILDALTGDAHFRQAGFNPLLAP